MLHSEPPFEVLRDTIIVNRPFNDPTEFQIVAWVDASEVGIEAARDNAKLIVEACNNFSLMVAHKEWYAQMKDEQFQKVYAKYHKQAEEIFKKITTVDNLATEGLGFADNEKKELTSTWNEVTPAPKEILNGFYRMKLEKIKEICSNNALYEEDAIPEIRKLLGIEDSNGKDL
jgi:hypothetical protein